MGDCLPTIVIGINCERTNHGASDASIDQSEEEVDSSEETERKEGPLIPRSRDQSVNNQER